MQFQGDLPPKLNELLANCPKSGSGERLVHRWILECGTQLRHYVLIDTAALLIGRAISRPPKPHEIEETLQKAYSEPAQGLFTSRWPDPQAQLIDAVVTDYDDGTPGLRILRMKSHPIPATVQEIFGALFPQDPFLCAGLYQAHAAIAQLSKFKNLERFQFVVPNPMFGKFVVDRATGRRMERCLANVLERRYIVLDFDLKGDWIQPVLDRWARAKYTPQDGMATLIMFMERVAPLVLVVFSGNVSLQAWFYCLPDPVDAIAAWFNDACLLGADAMGWVSCQYFRMPLAWRKDPKALQEVIYFNPEAIS